MRKYRKLAEECLKVAAKIRNQNHRRAFLDLATEWLALADDDPKTARLIAEVEALKRPAN
jgi:hypothetical protein